MKLLIDADSCPVKDEIQEVAAKYSVNVFFVMSTAHFSSASLNCGQVILVDSSSQAVDMEIVNRASRGDIVVTQDYGLAALCLAKKCKAITPRGKIISDKDIEMLLEARHASEVIRKSGGRVKGPKSFHKECSLQFKRNLKLLLTECFFSKKEENERF
ncbi:hypothetical protein GGQ84_001602 [Desulfitispora alkaliphila]|uniref:YaiI/YqxD family protein n=1 Tax=Desulfitispora alkaliphila TaxID=622674 RepID=UPI003D1BB0AD